MAAFDQSHVPWSISNTNAGRHGFPRTVPKIDIDLKLAANILLKEANGGISTKNVVCSPLSLEFILHMLATGSKGDTLHQILNFIGPKSLELEDLNLKSTKIMSLLSSNGGGMGIGPGVSFVNGLWVDHRYPLKPSYKELLGISYKAQVKNVDFQQINQVIEDVNSWAANNTRGLIDQILSPEDLTPDPVSSGDPVFILGNALYFKGLWADSFDKSLTKCRDFYLHNGYPVSVPFMTSRENYFYGATNAFKVLKIPYKRGNDKSQFSMYFILPHAKDGLQSLLKMFNSNTNLHQNVCLNKTYLDELWIPRFKVSYMLEASKTMQDMGLTLPFMDNCQDFTEMVEIPPGRNIYVSKVIHKAVIEVDEEGTEAAAVTTAVMRFGGSFRDEAVRPKITFVADHPFMFLISEEATKAVLFVGALVNPQRD